jgi:hypothetical protein
MPIPPTNHHGQREMLRRALGNCRSGNRRGGEADARYFQEVATLHGSPPYQQQLRLVEYCPTGYIGGERTSRSVA